MSLDVAASKETGNYSAFTIWGHRDGNWYLTAAHRFQYELPEVRKRLLEFDRHYRPDLIVVDGVGVGRGLVQQLRHEGFEHIDSTKGGGQIADAEAIAPFIQGGRVFYRQNAPGLTAFRDEVMAFPKGKYDDQVDSMLQLLKRGSRVVSCAQQLESGPNVGALGRCRKIRARPSPGSASKQMAEFVASRALSVLIKSEPKL